MNENNDVVKIRVELDTGSLQASVKQADAAVEQVTRTSRNFFELERSQLERLKSAWDQRQQQLRQYAKDLDVTQNVVRQLEVAHRREERAALQASASQQRAERTRQRELRQAATEAERLHNQELRRQRQRESLLVASARQQQRLSAEEAKAASLRAKESERALKALQAQERQEQQLAQRRQRQNAQAARFPGTAVLGNAQGVGSAIFGAVLAGGGFGGGGFLPTVGGVAAGALGASIPVIGGIVAGLSLVNGAINTGMDLTRQWVSIWYDYRVTIERAKLGLGVLLGSQEKAAQYTQDLLRDLRGLGDLDSALVLSRRLLNVGLAADEARRRVVELNALATGLGLNETEQKGLAKALSDTLTAGKLRGQEVLQFSNAGVSIKRLVADQLGITQREVDDLTKKGRVAASTVLAALSKEARRYEPVMEQALLLPEVSLNRIRQQLGRIGDGVFGPLFGDLAQQLKDAANQLEKTDAFDDAIFLLGVRFGNAGADVAGKFLGGMLGYLADPSNLAQLTAGFLALQTTAALTFFNSLKRGFGFGNNYSTFSGTNTPVYDEDVMTPAEIAQSRHSKGNGGRLSATAGDSGSGGGTHRSRQKSFSEQLRDRLRRTQEQVNALTNLNSRNFAVKFESERYERLQRDLETILNLRYELGIAFNTPLPKTSEAATQMKEELESAKRVYDGVKQAREELRKASEDLAISIQSLALPVVESEIRFQTQYNRLLRERRNEEQQLTADLKLEVQQRIDALSSQEEQARQSRVATLRAFTGSLSDNRNARQALLEAETQRRLRSENANVFDVTGEFAPATSALTPLQSLDRTVGSIFALLQQKFGGGGAQATADNSGGNGAGAPAADGDVFRIETKELRFNELRRETARALAEADAQNLLSALEDDILQLQETERTYLDESYRLKVRDLETQKRRLLQQQELRQATEEAGYRELELQQHLLDLGDASSQRSALRRKEVSNDLLSEQVATKERLIELEERLARAGEGAADRYREAWLDATLDVAHRNEQAVERQIRAQVELSQQTVFSAEQARANILEGLSQAKGYTDIFSEAFLSATDAIGDGIANLLGRTTQKLGALGQIVTNIGSQLLKLVTNRLLLRLVDALLPGGAGGGGVPVFGGTGGVPVASRVLTATGGFLTPGFNPNASALGIGNGLNTITGASAAGISLVNGLPQALPNIPIPPIGGAVGAGATGALSLTKQLTALAPFLGFSLGAGVGGNSALGSLAGSIGGALGGLVLAASTGAIGGTLGSTFALSGALGPAALVAAPLLLLGGYLLGKAKQRKQDESVVDTYWVSYKDRLIELTNGVRSNRIDGDDALRQAAEARAQAVAQIMTISTKSVRESRLAHEIPNVDRLFLEPLKQAVEDQRLRRTNASTWLPEFAIGGTVPGPLGRPQLIIAHGGEIIANPAQQTPELLAAAARAGIPGLSAGSGGSLNGGNLSNAASGNHAPVNLEVTLLLGTETQNQLFVNGAKSPVGYRVLVRQQEKAQRLRDNNN